MAGEAHVAATEDPEVTSTIAAAPRIGQLPAASHLASHRVAIKAELDALEAAGISASPTGT